MSIFYLRCCNSSVKMILTFYNLKAGKSGYTEFCAYEFSTPE